MGLEDRMRQARANLCRSTGLCGAALRQADLNEMNLSAADLTGAFLLGTDLRRADLQDAALTGADLSGSDLRGANPQQTEIEGILDDPKTRSLDGFDPRRAR